MNAAYEDSEVNKEPVRRDVSERTGSLYARSALVVGLTGGIATGKTTVARMFEELGAKVSSADEVVHRLLECGTEVARRIAEEFEGILGRDGCVDRKKLGEIVFRDSEKRRRLEAIVHPPVLRYLAEEAERFRSSGKGVLILEVPLLIETGYEKLVDRVIVVAAEQETQIMRLQYRYHISREEALLRIRSQLSVSEKVKYADWVISTEGSLQDTRKQVERVWHSIQKSLAPAK